MTEYSIGEAIRKLREENVWYASSLRPPDFTESQGEWAAGINVVGYLRDESGWGAAGRGYIRALQMLNLPIALKDLSEHSSNRSEDNTIAILDARHPHGVNLICVDPGQHYAMMGHVGEGFLEGHYNIGAWAWELPRFPVKWYDRFAYYDEIWVTTSFVANALAPISPVPVVRIPPVLTSPRDGSRNRGRQRLGVTLD